MLGRDADWQASTAVLPARQMLDRVAAIGFDGLVYDTGSIVHRRRADRRRHLGGAGQDASTR